MASFVYDNGIELLAGWTGRTIKTHWVTALTQDRTDKFVSDVTKTDFAGSGYTSKALTGLLATLDAANNQIEYDATDETQAGVSAGSAVIGFLVYEELGADTVDRCICYLELASTFNPSGGTVDIAWDAEGLVKNKAA